MDSYPTYANSPVFTGHYSGQGQTKHLKFSSQQVRKTSSVNIYSRTYKSPSQADSREVANYGKDDPYTATESNYQYPSMIASLCSRWIDWFGDFLCDCRATWFSYGSLQEYLD